MTEPYSNVQMELKWPKWKFQSWKSPPIWDSTILPRKFEESKIRYMECFEFTFLLILSNNSCIEIWNVQSGSILYNKSFVDLIEYIDFVGLYKQEETNSNHDWTIFMANKNGLLIFQKCDSSKFHRKFYNPSINSINKCFYKSIGHIKTIVLISKDISIVNCSNLELLLNIPEPFKKEIDCLLVTNDTIVAGSDEHLTIFQISVKEGQEITWKPIKKLNYHKNRILNLIDVDDNCFASISCEAVKIWKRPEYNIIRMFNTGNESTNITEKSVFCCINNSKYLTVAFNCGFFIFDCIMGSTLTKITDAHDAKIIGITYCNWLSMLFTVADDGVARFWAFQLTDCGLDSKRIHSTSPMSKTLKFSSYLIFSFSKSLEERTFLGKSLEKYDKECQQLSCFLECRYSIKSKNHFVNLEEIGILTNDGSSNLLLWRNRDYVFNRLIKLLQNQ